MKRGRPQIRDYDHVDQIILENCEFILLNNNKICSKSHEIWQTLSMETEILCSSLHTYVTCNRNNIRDKLENLRGKNLSGSEIVQIAEENNDKNDSFNDRLDKAAESERTIEIFLSKREFDDLLVYKNYNRNDKKNKYNKSERTYPVFKSMEWGLVMNKKIFEKMKTTCGFNFNTHKLYMTTNRGTMEGYCKCGSIIEGDLNGLNEEVISIQCRISEGNGECGKLFLRGKEREIIAKEMTDKKICPEVYRAQEADKVMLEGDLEPATLYTSSVLRNAKFEYESKSRIDSEPFKALALMQLQTHQHMIHSLQYNPIKLKYWSNHQVVLYNNYAAKDDACLLVDATGGFRKFKRFDESLSKTIYLYILVIHTGTNQFSVAQMLTEAHHTNSISDFIKEFIRTGAFPPKETVCDMAPALLTGIVQALINPTWSVDDYADACFSNVRQLPTYIRIDVAHLTHLYAIFLKDKHPSVKKLYKKMLHLIIVSRNVEAIKKAIYRFYVVCLSVTEDTNVDGSLTTCERVKEELKLIFYEGDKDEGDTFEPENRESLSELHDPIRSKGKKNYWESFGEKIRAEVEEEIRHDKGSRCNSHINKELADYLQSHMHWLPLWSCVCRDEFNCGRVPASSASVESEFNNIKNRVLANLSKPYRFDDFFLLHTNYLSGKLKIVHAAELKKAQEKVPEIVQQERELDDSSKKCQLCKKTLETNSSLTHCDSCQNNKKIISSTRHEEGWGGLNIPQKYPDTDFLLHDKLSKLPFLRNGNYLDLQPFQKSGKKITLRNTCAFDSIFQLLLVGFIEHPFLKIMVDQYQHIVPIFEMIVKVSEKGTNAGTYNARANILIPHTQLDIDKIKDCESIDCQTTARNISCLVLEDAPGFTEKMVCTNNCPAKTCHYLTFTVSETILFDEHPNSLETHILLPDELCLNCGKGTRSSTFSETGICLILELISRNFQEPELCLGYIPKEKIVSGTTYHLLGAIKYRPPISTRRSDSNIGHYTAIALHKNSDWVEYDDCNPKKVGKKMSPDTVCKISLVLYVS